MNKYSRGRSRPGTAAFSGIGTGTVSHPAGIGSSAVFPVPFRTMREREFGTFSDISYAIIMYSVAYLRKTVRTIVHRVYVGPYMYFFTYFKGTAVPAVLGSREREHGTAQFPQSRSRKSRCGTDPYIPHIKVCPFHKLYVDIRIVVIGRILMDGRTFQFLGGDISRQNFNTQLTHKNQRYRTNHGGRRRRPTEAFRGNYPHDITPIESPFHRLLIYAPPVFLLRLVLGG